LEVKNYCQLAHRTKNVKMLETAYQMIPPGGNRCIVAGRWAALLCTTRDFEATHALMSETLELPEERQAAVALLLSASKRGVLSLTPEQRETLKAETR
jgi:hypothetical protein